MKLLMISGDRSILQGKRGAFWYTLEEFSKHWERIDVICPQTKIQSPKLETISNVKNLNVEIVSEFEFCAFSHVFFHPSPYSLWRQSKWILEKGKALIAEHHHDVVTVHEYPPFYNGIGAYHLHQATGIPYALEVHHIVGWPRAATLTEWIGRVASRWQIPRSAYHARAVRVVNHEVQGVLAQWGIPAEKIQSIPSFYLDTEKLRPNPSVQRQYDVVFCGRLVANKGLAEVVRAVAGLPGVSLLIIGDGPERGQAEALVRSLQITDRVTFRGWLPSQEEVIAAMQSAKVFVMNSSSEGGPRVALEAMALGMPVIATRVGVMPEVIEDGVSGVFTDGTTETLQSKLQMLLRDPALRDRLGKDARKITERFERGKLIKAYADFLKALCAS